MLKLKIGVFGAGRGNDLAQQLVGNPDAELVAVCDKYLPALEECRRKAEAAGCGGVTYYQDFEEFFKHDMDAVVLANYAYQHAPYAIRFLKSGRHVLSEVLTCATMKEAVELIEAVESSGMIYSYAENYCYCPSRWELRRRYLNGDIGELVYAEGEYVHDCSSDPRCQWSALTYGEREHWRNISYSTFYCTHSLGPILQMTELRPVKVIGLQGKNADYLRAVGTAQGCCGLEMVTLENGAIVKSLHGNLKRTKSQGSDYVLNGTRGGLYALKNGQVEVYTENPEESLEERYRTYADRFQTYDPPVLMQEAEHTGHGGGDFYTTYYFIKSILGDEDAKKCTIDVYQAVDMCICGILAYRSIVNGNVPVDVPNLRNKEERDAFRNDTFCTFRDIAGDQWVPNNLHGEPIPEEVFDNMKALWHEKEKKLSEERGNV